MVEQSPVKGKVSGSSPEDGAYAREGEPC